MIKVKLTFCKVPLNYKRDIHRLSLTSSEDSLNKMPQYGVQFLDQWNNKLVRLDASASGPSALSIFNKLRVGC